MKRFPLIAWRFQDTDGKAPGEPNHQLLRG
jgi:hypothetical protein